MFARPLGVSLPGPRAAGLLLAACLGIVVAGSLSKGLEVKLDRATAIEGLAGGRGAAARLSIPASPDAVAGPHAVGARAEALAR